MSAIPFPTISGLFVAASDVYLRAVPLCPGAYSPQRLDTDPIGEMVLTLTNLVVGSAIRVEIASTGALIELRTADATTEIFAVPVYGAGSALNNLVVKVRKGSSAPYYRPYETQVEASVSSQSVFIAQALDE